MKTCTNKECDNYDAETINNCNTTPYAEECDDYLPLKEKTADGSKVPCSVGLCALIEGWEISVELLQNDIKENEGKLIACEYRRTLRQVEEMIKEAKELIERST